MGRPGQRERRFTVCFFGDGTTNIGAFHEALNFAAVWTLPVVFVCENNHYMEYTPIADVIAVKRPAADRAAAYGLAPIVVDGNDVDAVHAALDHAVSRARDGGGPSLVEAETYRHGGHSAADPAAYRSAEEVAQWKERDPLILHTAALVAGGCRRRSRRSTSGWAPRSTGSPPRPSRRPRPTRRRRGRTCGATGARRGATDPRHHYTASPPFHDGESPFS